MFKIGEGRTKVMNNQQRLHNFIAFSQEIVQFYFIFINYRGREALFHFLS